MITPDISLRFDGKQEVYISQVKPTELSYWWATVTPWLERGHELWSERYDLKDIYVAVFSGTMQLWMVGEEEGPFGCMLTEISAFPKCKVLRFLFAAGENDGVNKLELNAVWHEYIIQWAKSQGAVYSEISGRRGWERVARPLGYEFHSVFLVKNLEKTWSN